MNIDSVTRDFKSSVCEQLRVVPEGKQRYRVFTPFLFEDGDHLAIVLKQEHNQWLLSDEGHTYMRLTYDIDEKDLGRGTRQKIINDSLSAFQVRDREGELMTMIDDKRYGDALYSFIQALLKIADVSFLNRERVRSTFIEDLRAFIEERVPKQFRAFDWRDTAKDPQGNYLVDCRIQRAKGEPLFIYALSGDDKVRDATIGLHQFEQWKVEHLGVGVFENQEDISRKVLARFSDVSDKQFSNLVTNHDRSERYIVQGLPS